MTLMAPLFFYTQIELHVITRANKPYMARTSVTSGVGGSAERPFDVVLTPSPEKKKKEIDS